MSPAAIGALLTTQTFSAVPFPAWRAATRSNSCFTAQASGNKKAEGAEPQH